MLIHFVSVVTKKDSVPNTLFCPLERWKKSIDNKVLLDLYKTLTLLTVNFSLQSYMLLGSQRTKINTSFSTWKELLQQGPQGSFLGPLLLKIYLNSLFFFLNCNACKFAEDTTSFVFNKNLDLVLVKLECNSDIAIQFFL